MRPIDAEALEKYAAAIFGKFEDATPPIVADLMTNAIKNAPTIETKADALQLEETYIKGYNAGAEMALHIINTYGNKEEEPEK